MIPRSIPVGMFHHVNQNAGDFLTVSAGNFRRQMDGLRREQYETLDAQTFLAALRGEYVPKRRCCVLTFDDAWLDIYTHAYPVLKECGHKFIVFAVSDWCDQAATVELKPAADHAFPTHHAAMGLVKQQRASEVVCSWKHLREMQDSGLASIENHTATHRDALALDTETLRADLLSCRAAIRTHLARDSQHLCWPRGRHNAAGLRLARELGFATTYLVRRGVNVTGGGTFAVKRFTVEDRDETWLKRQLAIFSGPVRGHLYARLKPDRWFRKLAKKG